ncbi:hypothetical protein ACQJBY_068489 [Aegilops geniculata]
MGLHQHRWRCPGRQLVIVHTALEQTRLCTALTPAEDDFVMCHASRKSSSSYDDVVVFDLQGRVPASGYASNQYNHDMVQSTFSDELPPLHQQQHRVGCCSIEFNSGALLLLWKCYWTL